MPLEEFREELRGRFALASVEELSEKFGSSFEATVFRLATAHAGIAVAGLLRYRLRKGEERALANSSEQLLFQDMKQARDEVPEPKYRRQSFFSSIACSDQHTIRWNKSFDLESCVYLAAKSGHIVKGLEVLPNQSRQDGTLEVIRAPFQREDAHPEFPDLFFFWSTNAPIYTVRSEAVCAPAQTTLL